jgi:beta-phosphoglucomutase
MAFSLGQYQRSEGKAMLRAVILDFDGVITDSEILHFRALNKVLAKFSFEMTKKDYYQYYLGLSDLDFFKELQQKGQLRLDSQQMQQALDEKKQLYEKLAITEGRIIEGVRGFLEMLRQNNIPMAICSGAILSEINLILEGARLRNFFEVIVSAEQIKKGKPAPDGLLLALQRLNCRKASSGEKNENPITADRCVVIEDSHWGLEAAKAAGMHPVAVTNSYDAQQLTPAEKVVDCLSELSMNDLQELCR